MGVKRLFHLISLAGLSPGEVSGIVLAILAIIIILVIIAYIMRLKRQGKSFAILPFKNTVVKSNFSKNVGS